MSEIPEGFQSDQAASRSAANPLTIYQRMKENALKGGGMDVNAFLNDAGDLDSTGVLTAGSANEQPRWREQILQTGQDPLLWQEVYRRVKDSVRIQDQGQISKILRLAHLLGMDQTSADPRGQEVVDQINIWKTVYREEPRKEEQVKPPEAQPVSPPPPAAKVEKQPPKSIREAILNQIDDPETRGVMAIGVYPLVGQLRPYSDRSDYLWRNPEFAEWVKWDPQGKFIDVIRKQANQGKQGQFFRDVFALAASADSPIALQNALGALEAVSPMSFSISRRQGSTEIQQMMIAAQEAFLQTTITPAKVNPLVEVVTKEIVDRWENSRGSGFTRDPNYLYNIFKDTFLEKYARSWKQTNSNSPFFTETFYNMIFNQNIPMELRKLTLSSIPFGFGFGVPDSVADKEGRQVKPFFQNTASFWRDIDVSWIYPHMAYFKKSAAEPSRSEIDQDSLGREYDRLHHSVSGLEAKLSGTEEELAKALLENQRLGFEIGELLMGAGASAFSERGRVDPSVLEAARYYKEFGGHPLAVLGIGTVFWKNWGPDERKHELTKAYRTKARELHYDVPRQYPKYDEQKALLMGQAFARVTAASKFLENNLNRGEFPDLRFPS